MNRPPPEAPGAGRAEAMWLALHAQHPWLDVLCEAEAGSTERGMYDRIVALVAQVAAAERADGYADGAADGAAAERMNHVDEVT